MGKYVNYGKQLLHIEGDVTTHIADCGDNEMAHALATGMNERSTAFIPQALQTCSPLFHGDMVSDSVFRGTINDAIETLNRLDKIKKSLFYGRDNNLISEGQSDVSDLPENFGGNSAATVRPIAIDILHAILGVATEAGELLERLRNTYNGDVVDWVNIQEEMGDIFWYFALLANHGDFTFEETQTKIIAKLRARFPDKFTEFDANNRNLAVERDILEGGDLKVGGKVVGKLESISIAASVPASGPEAVRDVEASADAAFNAIRAVGDDSVDASAQNSVDPELSKGIGERLQDMPGEKLARQPIRKKDAK